MAGLSVTRADGEHDGRVVRSILNHPRIWPHLFDEPLSADWLPQAPGVFLLVRDASAIAVAILSPENSVTCQVHHAVLPKAWGPKAIQAGHSVMEYIFAAGWQCVTGWTPVTNTAALRFARALGMEPGGICPASYEEAGKIVDRQHYHMTRARWETLERLRREMDECRGQFVLAARLLGEVREADTPEKWCAASARLEGDGIEIGRYDNAFHMRDTLMSQLAADARLFESQMSELRARRTRI